MQVEEVGCPVCLIRTWSAAAQRGAAPCRRKAPPPAQAKVGGCGAGERVSGGKALGRGSSDKGKAGNLGIEMQQSRTYTKK